jgi:hypothetical protein
MALSRAFTREALRAAERHGGPLVRAFVRDSVAARNVVTALLLAGARTESPTDEYFLEGADRPTLDTFRRAASAASRVECADVLGTASAGTFLAGPLATAGTSASTFARAVLAARVDHLWRQQRTHPLSAAPVLLFVLRLRLESEIVRRSIWSASYRTGRAA